MRVGHNPQKLARTTPHVFKIPVKQPEELTLTTVTFIPNLVGYYRYSLDVLKLSLASIIKNTPAPFDLMVFDNGSCEEVVSFLLDLKQKDLIQWLFLSSRNMKKGGAWNMVFPAARGKYIYYFDSDILHEPGWLENSKKILDAFPDAGQVNAFPFIIPNRVEPTLNTARRDPGTRVERGDWVDESLLAEMADSLGSDPRQYIESRKQAGIYKISRHGVDAVAAASHCQFLARAELIHSIFPRPSSWAGGSNPEKDFDQAVEDSGLMRLGTIDGYIRHLGNTIPENLASEVDRYSIEGLTHEARNKSFGQMPSWLRKFLLWKPIRVILMRIYGFIFKLVYGVN